MRSDDCTHQGAHVHGTLACAVRDACSCPSCHEVHTRYRARRARKIAYGQWRPLRDATPVRDHLVQLRRAGMSLVNIAEETARAGTPVSVHTLKALVYGRASNGQYRITARVRPETAVAVLRIRPPRQKAAARLTKVLHLCGARIETLAAVRVGRDEAVSMLVRDLDIEHRSDASTQMMLRAAIRQTYPDLELPAAERAPLARLLGECGLRPARLAQLLGVSARTIFRDQEAAAVA